MKFLNISIGGGISKDNLEATLIYKLLEKLSVKPLKYTNLPGADLIFYGPYYNFYEKLFNKFKNKIMSAEFFDPTILKFFKKEKKNSKKIFLSFENSIKFRNIKADYYFTSFLGISSKDHLRVPYWKNCANWPEYDISFDKNKNNASHRYGESYEIDKLMQELGDSFLKRNKKFCFFTSHMMYPRNEIYNIFKKSFDVDGYGPYFNKKSYSHNSGLIKKKNILKNYSFNLCPHTFSTPGLYSSDISDAFLSGCLPITWTDNNIENDFNKNAFVNLINYQNENYKEIINLLKDDKFLNSFVKEPLLLKKPNLDKEIEFVQNILNNL